MSDDSYYEEEIIEETIPFDDEEFYEEDWEEEVSELEEEIIEEGDGEEEEYVEEEYVVDLKDKIESSYRSLVNRPSQITQSLVSVDEEDSKQTSLSSSNKNSNNNNVNNRGTRGRIERPQHERSQHTRSSVDASIDASASVDFDLGSFDEDMSESSAESPDDYELACRVLIETMYADEEFDADDMIRRCDLPTLYRNLRQQYRHLERSNSKKGAWEGFEEQDSAVFQGGPFGVENSPQPRMNDDRDVEAANRLPKKSALITADDGSPTKTIKWLNRFEDDPDDYEEACTILFSKLYPPDDEDHDLDTMMRRSTPLDLYRYLKQEYWYRMHTGNMEESTASTNKVSTRMSVEDNLAAKLAKQQQSSQAEAIYKKETHHLPLHQRLENNSFHAKEERRIAEGGEKKNSQLAVSSIHSDDESYFSVDLDAGSQNMTNESDKLPVAHDELTSSETEQMDRMTPKRIKNSTGDSLERKKPKYDSAKLTKDTRIDESISRKSESEITKELQLLEEKH